ncbi:MAG: argininosuccinate lyase [Christensenellaceae bacterium]|jgi:argininosuccinate lyase|nr:argininosuccinate lyase [Christensenellaceae bacterium]
MEKLWTGRFHKQLDAAADDFNASIRVDKRMVRHDIEGSLAHAAMLAAKGIIPAADAEAILAGLGGILDDLASGALPIDLAAEDVHTFVETELTRRIGDAGKKLHTARSRNDQVALDIRLTLREDAAGLQNHIKTLIQALAQQAEEHANTITVGYTHLQRAQPITFGHHLLAYTMMLLRDGERLQDAAARMNISPLGSCALAGTTYDTDRLGVAGALHMQGVCLNSLDGVSDRDFCVELASTLAIIMMHLSRLCEEIILWCSWEFGFVELDDAYSTGSSIMPQKKNPDIAELIRGKTGRVYGDLLALLTLLKGLPLAYNKDMQEDKEAIFDAVDTVKACLGMAAPMVATMRVRPENMRKAAAGGFINATDCADYLAKKGLPFRSAYKATGEIVAYCIAQGKTLETMTLAEYQQFSALFEQDVYAAIELSNCVLRRNSLGGAAPEQVYMQLAYVKERIAAW